MNPGAPGDYSQPVHRYDPARRRLAICLAALAGYVDAVGFVEAGGYFVSFMSGNTTRLGVDLASNLSAALLPLGLIGSFTFGAFVGALLCESRPKRRKTIALGSAAILLVLSNVLLVALPGLCFLGACAMAMGALNNAFSREGEVQIGVTYLNGALVRLAQGLALRVRGQDASRHGGYGALWLGLAAGSLAGAASFAIGDSIGLQLAAVGALALFLIAWRIERSAN
ncbi:YoaK family protein [Qipengyuania sp. CAU 1752]